VVDATLLLSLASTTTPLGSTVALAVTTPTAPVGATPTVKDIDCCDARADTGQLTLTPSKVHGEVADWKYVPGGIGMVRVVAPDVTAPPFCTFAVKRTSGWIPTPTPLLVVPLRLTTRSGRVPLVGVAVPPVSEVEVVAVLLLRFTSATALFGSTVAVAETMDTRPVVSTVAEKATDCWGARAGTEQTKLAPLNPQPGPNELANVPTGRSKIAMVEPVTVVPLFVTTME
jgi:hypothetical protein